MLFDFLQQFLYATIFFFGIAGIGNLVLGRLGYSPRQQSLLNLAIAYFFSLCLYIVVVVAVLFLTPFSDKSTSLILVTVLYGTASFAILGYYLNRSRERLVDFYQSNQRFILIFFATLLVALFLFFLQTYRTAILDEWLHRPIVSEFISHGIFPLVNPLTQDTNYIQTYHYGTQVVASAIALVFSLDASTALDVFKLSYFLATTFLFFGIIYFWTLKPYLAIAGAVLVVFSGSSFFFLDSFTASHLISFKGWGLSEGEHWPINAALSYILTGITWINIPLVIAFGWLSEQLAIPFFRRSSKTLPILILGLVGVGFYLISELFLVVLLVAITPFIVYTACQEKAIKSLLISGCIVALIVILGIFFSGGVIGKILQSKLSCLVTSSCQTNVVESDSVVVAPSSVNIERAAPGFLILRSPSLWGYPSEKRILVIWDRPWYYLRTLMLELLILVLLAYAGHKKMSIWKEHPILTVILAIGLIGPFFFSTSFLNVNFSKTTTASFVLLHIFIFYLIARLPLQRWFAGVLIIFLFLGSISGLLIGSNIQWQWLSSKGKSQFCSQNPLCEK